VAAATIGGFAHSDGGFQLSVKRWLLSHEGAVGPLRQRGIRLWPDSAKMVGKWNSDTAS
jgi:hypothetical protein